MSPFYHILGNKQRLWLSFPNFSKLSFTTGNSAKDNENRNEKKNRRYYRLKYFSYYLC